MKAYCFIDAGPGKEHCDDRVLVNDSIIASGFYELELQEKTHASFAVADGVGGNRAGYYAALRAVSAISESVLPPELSTDKLRQRLLDENENILSLSAKDWQLYEMATTLSGICCDGERWYLYHIGNTRVYQWAFGSLNQLTEDHSWLRDRQLEGIDIQLLSESSRRNEITACLGGGDASLVNKLYVKEITGIIHNSQRILITSDGMHEYIDHSILEASMEGISDYQEYFRQAVRYVRENGSPDDISILLIDFQ